MYMRYRLLINLRYLKEEKRTKNRKYNTETGDTYATVPRSPPVWGKRSVPAGERGLPPARSSALTSVPIRCPRLPCC